MNTERLLKVAKALRESPKPKAFYMGKYGYTSSDDYGYGCGTPACAMGHYAARRDLQRTFKLSDDGELTDNDGMVVWHSDEDACQHFDITHEQALRLFDGIYGCGYAKTAKQAAKYIERFVARGGK